MYFSNPVDLLKAIYSSSLRAEMHVRMADLVCPSNVPYYHCDSDCFCLQGMSDYPGRVLTIGRDKAKDASLPSLLIVIIINFDTKDYPIPLHSNARELKLLAGRSWSRTSCFSEVRYRLQLSVSRSARLFDQSFYKYHSIFYPQFWGC